MNNYSGTLMLCIAWILVVKGELFYVTLYTSSEYQADSPDSPYLTLHGNKNTEAGIKLTETGFIHGRGTVTNLLIFTQRDVGHVTDITLTSGGDNAYGMMQMSLQNAATGEMCHVVCEPHCFVDTGGATWPESVNVETTNCSSPDHVSEVTGAIIKAGYRPIPVLEQMVSGIGTGSFGLQCSRIRCAQTCLSMPECRAYSFNATFQPPHCCQHLTIPTNTGVRSEAGMSPVFVEQG